MRILRSPDANTETASSAVDAKAQAEVSSTTENKQQVSPLVEAMKIADAAEGGKGEVEETVTENEESSEGDVLKKNGTEEDEAPEGKEAENKPEGDEEQDEKVEEEETEKGDDEAETDKQELTPEQKAENERFDKHPRFQELNQKVKDLEPLAKSQRSIEDYCKTNNITGAQFQQALQMAALMNVDPVKARAALLPIMESLNSYVGEKLPQDLEDRVNKGTLDINDAKEIAQLRAQKSMATSRQQLTQQQQFDNQCAQAVVTWETSKRKTDPDYAKKEDLIIDIFSAKIANSINSGTLPSPQDRVRFAEEAWDKVTKRLTSFLPSKPVKRSFKTNGSRQTQQAEAKTPLEIAQRIASKA